MNRLRVGMDVDGVLCDFDSHARSLITHRFENIDLPPYSRSWASLKDEAGPDAWQWLWSPEGGLRLLFSACKPYPGAVEAAQEIAEYADVVIITSVPGAAIHDRTDWLARHRIPCAELHVTAQPKHLVKPHCAVYLDDGPHNVGDLWNHTQASLLVWRRPWNEREVVEDVRTRFVDDWQEVIDFVRHSALTLDTYVV